MVIVSRVSLLQLHCIMTYMRPAETCSACPIAACPLSDGGLGELLSRGLRHAPDELPVYQHERVRLWLMGSPAGDLIEGVLSVSPSGDQIIRDAVESDAAEILDKVKELVCS